MSRLRIVFVAALFATACVTAPEVKPDTDSLPDGGAPAETAEIPYEAKPKTDVEVTKSEWTPSRPTASG